MQRLGLLAGFIVLALAASPAQAHFLFVRIGPPAEGGRAAEVYFSEMAAAGDPRFIDKVASAVFEIQKSPGEFHPLEMRKLDDRLRAHLPIDGPLMVVGQLDYGVLSRPLQPTFLLRHYSKAVAGKPEELNRFEPRRARLEIVPHFNDQQLTLSALLAGKPMPNAVFTVVDADLSEEEIKGDAEGRAAFVPKAPGVYSIYIRHVDATPGEHAGKPYKEVREFATLSFDWPLARQGADAEAVELFESALAARAVWADFPGFDAKISGDVDDRPFEGTVSVAANGSVQVKLEDDALLEWVVDQLSSITMHRAASQRPSAERARPVLRFADDHVDHPLGRLLVFEGGEFATSYRVKDRQITSVNRLLDGKNMTITVLENQQNAEGRYLPRNYLVQYWDEATGNLQRAESVQDRWTRVDRWDLPSEHVVTVSTSDGFKVRAMRLSDFRIAGSKN